MNNHLSIRQADTVSHGPNTEPSPTEPILQFFECNHLPIPLQRVSQPFGALAEQVALLPRNAERSVALRKLLEAKDAAVRAMIALALLLCLVPMSALAQDADPAEVVSALGILIDALARGPAGVGLAVAAGLLVLVQVLRAFGARIHPALGSGRAAAILAVVLPVVGAIVTTLASGGALTVAVVLNAILAGLTASGLFSASRAIVQRAEARGDLAVIRDTQTKAAQLAAIGQSPDA